MKRMFPWIMSLGCVLALGAPTSGALASPRVSVDLHFGDPYRGPRVVFEDEPDIVVIPGTRVYRVLDDDYDIYRCGRYWYYNYDDDWYRARSYRGPWFYVGYRGVPRQVGYAPFYYHRHWREFRHERGYVNPHDRGYFIPRGRGRGGEGDWRHHGGADD